MNIDITEMVESLSKDMKFRIFHASHNTMVEYGMGNRNGAKVMRCTGLKDDNGNDIYEGDILHLSYHGNEVNIEWMALVVFGNPNGVNNWGFQLVPLSNCYANKEILLWVETENPLCDCEIVGNVFENPELLGGKE